MQTRNNYDELTAGEFDAPAYSVPAYPGVAWHVLGWETEPDDDTEWSGLENRTGNVIAVMVGDDRHFAFEPDELTAVGEGAYCASCGQIGCSHGG